MTPTCLVALAPFLAAPLESGAAAPGPVPQEDWQTDVADSGFDYRYLEAALVFGDLYGARVGGSFPIEGPWLAVGRAEFLTDDEGAADVDLFLASGGAGYVHTVQEDFDLVGTAELEFGRVEVDTPGNDVSDDDVGVRLRAGVRYRVNEQFELAGGTTFRTIFDEDVGLDGTALYSFTDDVQGFVGFDVQDETFGFVGVRVGL